MSRRLIEEWLPIAALGEESVRERRSMTALPPTYYLHVWWARRPLVASRAAVLASLLPADADHEKFMHMLGIHGDPVAAQRSMDVAKRAGVRVTNPYGYKRAFTYMPSDQEREDLRAATQRLGLDEPQVLDPTAGGGSIPFESVRLGLTTLANDLNPVAALILKATVEWPSRLGAEVVHAYQSLSSRWRKRMEDELAGLFPQEAAPAQIDTTYLWARTVTCPHCGGLVPLSPNWRLAPDGTGVRLVPDEGRKVCDFDIVQSASEQSEGTVSGGDGRCPYPSCGRLIEGDDIKKQAQDGKMGDQLFAVVYKRRVIKPTKSGKGRESWVRGYRAPTPADDNSAEIAARLAEKLPEWEALDIVPTEAIPDGLKTREPIRLGMTRWRDMFSPRQLLCHGTSVEVFRELLDEEQAEGPLDEVTKAAFVYLSFTLDKLRDYSSRLNRWHSARAVIANTFSEHNLAVTWSYAEMDTLIAGLGYDWAIKQTGKCIDELVDLARPDLANSKSKNGQLALGASAPARIPDVTVTVKSADNLDHLGDQSVDVIVIDPPYYDNVMYAELSDFFYVWLKRTAGRVFPELFLRPLTDKDNEAVANPARHKGAKGAKALAYRDYRVRMAAIFAECRRVLKQDGVMTLMFTHKATNAWDALTSGLVEAGFTITASWPINTEAEHSLHIREKSAANSTIFLVCRPRAVRVGGEVTYWEDVEPMVAQAVRERVAQFQEAGIGGVDLYLSCFGPALQKFAEHWPLKRGQPKPQTQQRRRTQASFLDEEEDPYAVTPEDALDAARREVKRWRMEQLLNTNRPEGLDPRTEWFVLAWDAFKTPVFPYDEALRLARVVGVDLDKDIVGRLAEKKGSDLVLWDSARRAAKGVLGAADGSSATIDALHHVANQVRGQGLQAGRDLIERAGIDRDPAFATALTAILEVLPVSSTFTKVAGETGAVAEAANDFDALEHIRRLLFADRVPTPRQLAFWEEAAV